MDDITDMRRSCWLCENTSGQRPLGLSSRLLKVPNIAKFFVNRFCFVVIFCVQRIACRTKLCIFLEIYESETREVQIDGSLGGLQLVCYNYYL